MFVQSKPDCLIPVEAVCCVFGCVLKHSETEMLFSQIHCCLFSPLMSFESLRPIKDAFTVHKILRM